MIKLIKQVLFYLFMLLSSAWSCAVLNYALGGKLSQVLVDVETIPYATFNGGKVTVHNIRSNIYKSDTDYELRYYDRTFDISELKTVDLVASYWGMDAIAYLFLSFGFADASYLAISAETHKQVGQDYDALAGFFRNML
ncbi:MAG: DUF4105 domain-containing protein [Deltaproteobacteria bacterium]|nr:DUF4105 domain-containing protein [Deltaproteobacteria bacterium]